MSMMPPPPSPPMPPRPPMPNPAEQASLRAMQAQAQMRVAQSAAAYWQARKRRAAAEGNMPAMNPSPASSATAARIWLLIAWLLIAGVVLYVVFIR